MSKTEMQVRHEGPVWVDLGCHVLPLLDAIVWMGQASNKLSEIEAVKSFSPDMKWMDEIIGPECSNPGELVSGVAWVASSLLRRYGEERGAA
ncbi:hypothetical protein [Hydrogenophaga sp. H7]|uniref:hypothetical protein n=1 Tax=Hydrogenophaga sp. H7 TaxID=1882399 RepID=UPI0009A44DFF|nr:hypothetical protein [Hydrogenophaga sp. H7]OPF64081.1 hypothetical protein BC358_04250 [Hydrogenophaga sp. H7]